MKKKNWLFTKVLLAVAMTIMVFGVNKQTAMAEEVFNEETDEQEEVSGYEEEDSEETETQVHVHDYEYIIEESWVDEDDDDYDDGYKYKICKNYDGASCDEGHEQLITDTIYAPKKIKLSKTTYYYTGKKIKPSVTVYDRKGNVIKSSNYKVSYENNKYVGKGTITVTFKGKYYSGKLTKTFSIKAKSPKKTSIKSLKAYGKGFLIEINKNTDSTVVGYQVQYSKTKDFKNAKSFYVPNNGTKTGKTGLSKSTKYYVRVRVVSDVPTANEGTYSDVHFYDDGEEISLTTKTRVYSKWSAAKSVTTNSKDSSSPLLYTMFFDNRNLPYFYVKNSDFTRTKAYDKMCDLADDYFDANGVHYKGMSAWCKKKYTLMFSRTSDDGIMEGTETPADFGIAVY